jgi:DNA-binding LytR/AlgR family response regulator
MPDALHVLVVDDEVPVLDELAYLLRRDPRIGTVDTASSGAEALELLETGDHDAVFLDVAMPGLSGLSVARLLARFREPPKVVFVTAHDDHAVEAFELNASDYLLKPVREDRLTEAVRRIVETPTTEEPADDEAIAVELGGVTRFVQRSSVRFVEASGDYARLHTPESTHLVRVPLSTLEQQWAAAGFVRIHRSLLVATGHVLEVRHDAGRASVVVDLGSTTTELQVARRHTRELRDLLVRHSRPGSRT